MWISNCSSITWWKHYPFYTILPSRWLYSPLLYRAVPSLGAYSPLPIADCFVYSAQWRKGHKMRLSLAFCEHLTPLSPTLPGGSFLSLRRVPPTHTVITTLRNTQRKFSAYLWSFLSAQFSPLLNFALQIPITLFSPIAHLFHSDSGVFWECCVLAKTSRNKEVNWNNPSLFGFSDHCLLLPDIQHLANHHFICFVQFSVALGRRRKSDLLVYLIWKPKMLLFKGDFITLFN